MLLGHPAGDRRGWAQSYRFPMAPHNRESLPRSPSTCRWTRVGASRAGAVEPHAPHAVGRYREDLPAELLSEEASLEDLIAAAWKARHRREEVEPFSVLAQLPAPVYVTTLQSRLLARALTDAGPEAGGGTLPLARGRRLAGVGVRAGAGLAADVRAPAGLPPARHFDEPESLVLTEDDYFDFLIGVTRNQDLVPKLVRRRSRGLGADVRGLPPRRVGFPRPLPQPADVGGARRRAEYTHVAVQIDPEEGNTIDAGGPGSTWRATLETRPRLYWGSTENFVKELQRAWVSAMTTDTRRGSTTPTSARSFPPGDALYGRDRE